jgi:hypothetical protein
VIGEEATVVERRAAPLDAVRLLDGVGMPFVAVGAIARRRPVMGLMERVDADAITVRGPPLDSNGRSSRGRARTLTMP